MLVLVIVLFSFLVMWNTGQYFRNDLILLPFCGIERYNLNETRALEKMIVVGLMVFYFLIQSGYESIIISLISEVPFHPDIETLDHLREKSMPRSMMQEIFHKHVVTVFESGLFLRWYSHRQHMYTTRTSKEGENEDGDIVKFNDLAPFWAVVGIGWTLSIVVFMLERFTNLSMELKLKAPHIKRIEN
uniref:uncharacterized protein LOC125907199 n=1 Tax=Anopheles coluzzii TaxID=1518534 RepID=UPI0020FFB0B4|nr:uncharacterized protein LOC125907199 [Anopheles coluzzii]